MGLKKTIFVKEMPFLNDCRNKPMDSFEDSGYLCCVPKGPTIMFNHVLGVESLIGQGIQWFQKVVELMVF